MKPEVTVIIPCFMCSSTLERTVDSVFSQGVSCEVILINGCDGNSETTSTMNKTANKYSGKVKIFYSGINKGPGYDRNIGIKNASSEYIAFLDSDDYWLPGKLASDLAILKSSSVDGVCSYFAGEKIQNKKIRKIRKNSFLFKNSIHTSTFIGRKSKMGYFDSRLYMYAEDYLYFAIMLFSNNNIILIPENTTFYQTSHSQATKKIRKMHKGEKTALKVLYSDKYISIVLYFLALCCVSIKYSIRLIKNQLKN